MNRPLISIIIPTYNRAHLISETLDSIFAQTYSKWECIIVDDGSTDNTNSMIAAYVSYDSRFQFHRRPKDKPKGPSSCRNYGFELSKGEYVNWFDDDDVMMPDALQKRISFFKPNVDAVICKLQHYDFDKNVILNETKIISNNIINDYLLGVIIYFVSGPIWKREFLLKQKRLFDEGLSNLDDWDFNLRMLYANPNLIFVEEALIKYRVHNNSLSQQIIQLNFEEVKSELKARLKHLWLLRFKKEGNDEQFRKFMIKRNKSFLREALIVNNSAKYYLFRTLFVSQLLSFDFLGLVKSSCGFLSYNIINKGYFFFK
jgi:glycosyltransferase involved in cell wall biosynthesis